MALYKIVHTFTDKNTKEKYIKNQEKPVNFNKKRVQEIKKKEKELGYKLIEVYVEKTQDNGEDNDEQK